MDAVFKNTVYKKLLNIQSKLKAPKSQYNSFGKYNYRNCEDILEALKPLLAEEKAIIIISDEVLEIEGRFYIKATTEFIDIQTGESLKSCAYAREEETKKGMDGSQVTGASSSYARKYALNGLFAIDDNKDSDTTNTHGKEATKLTEAQIKRAYALGIKAGYDKTNIDKQVQAKFKKKLEDLTKEEYNQVCTGYEKMGGK